MVNIIKSCTITVTKQPEKRIECGTLWNYKVLIQITDAKHRFYSLRMVRIVLIFIIVFSNDHDHQVLPKPEIIIFEVQTSLTTRNALFLMKLMKFCCCRLSSKLSDVTGAARTWTRFTCNTK